MAGKDIKVTLTLDTSGFTGPGKSAEAFLKALRANLTDTKAVTEQFDKSISKLATPLDRSQKLMGTMSRQLSKLLQDTKAIRQGLDDAGKSVRDFNAHGETFGRSMGLVSRSVEQAAVSIAQLKPSVRDAADGMDKLEKASEKAAIGIKNSALSSIEFRRKQIESEKAAATEQIAIQDQLHRKYLEAERNFTSQYLAAQMEADGARRAKRPGSSAAARAAELRASGFKQSAELSSAQADTAALTSTALREEIRLREQLLADLEKETAVEVARAQRRQVEEFVGRRNSDTVKRLTEQAAQRDEADQKRRDAADRQSAQQRKQYFAELNAQQKAQAAEQKRLESEAAAAAAKAAKDAAAAKKAGDKEAAASSKAAAKVAADAAKEAAAAKKAADKDALAAQKAADKEAAESARAAARARAEAAREEAAAARAAAQARRLQSLQALREEKESARQIAQMWKSMGQIYAGSKIEKGLGASVNKAADYQDAKLSLTAMNLSPSDSKHVEEQSAIDSKTLKFASTMDMLNARLSVMGGLPNASQPLIDKLVPEIAKTAFNISRMTGDKDMHGFNDMVRNLTGVIEARGQTRDPEAANKTLDLVQRIYSVTGKKIDIKDLETFMRRDQTGADKLTDEGIMKIVAFIDAAKVSGGGNGGGGATGVSTVGTAFKMFQKMANGGTMTARAAEQFTEAGLMDVSQVKKGKSKDMMRQLRQGGLVVSDLSNTDPVEGLRRIADAAFAYMARPENIAKYFPTGEIHNEEARKNAMQKFAIGAGWSTSATAMLTQAGNEDIMDRARAQAEKGMNNLDHNQMFGESMKTYNANVVAFKSSLENLAVTLGNNLLPSLTNLAIAAKAFIDDINAFAQAHPGVATIVELGAAVGGLVLTLKGAAGLFGAGSALRSIVSMFTGMGGAAKTAAAGVAEVGAVATGVTGWISKMALAAGLTGGKFGGMALSVLGAGSKIIAVAGLIGKAFLRLIPIVGWIATAYSLAEVIGNLEVGGHKVYEWAEHFGRELYQKLATAWDGILAMFGNKAAQMRKAAADEEFRLKEQAKGFDMTPAPEKKGRSDSGKVRDLTVDDARESANRERGAQRLKDEAAQLKKEQEAKERAAKAAANRKFLSDNGIGSYGKDAAKKPKHAKKDQDPLDHALAEAEGHLSVQFGRIAALKTGKEAAENLLAAATKEVEAKRTAGDYDHYNEKTNKYDRPGADDPKIKRLAAALAKQRESEEQIKALTFVNERFATAQNEATIAMDRLTDSASAKQSPALRALQEELLRAEERLGAGAKGWAVWEQAKDKALFKRAGADLVNLAADQRDKNLTEAGGFLPTELARKKAELDFEEKQQRDLYQVRVDAYTKSRDATIAELQKEYDTSAATGAERVRLEQSIQDQIAAIRAEYSQKFTAAEETQTQTLVLQAEKRKRALEAPTEGLVRDWQDVNKQLGDASAGWMNGFVDMLTQGLGEGKLKFSDFVKSILLDVTKMQLKTSLAQPLNNLITSGVDSIRKNMFPNVANPISGTSANDDARELMVMNEKAREAGSALGDMAKGGVAEAAKATADQAAKLATGITDQVAYTSAVRQSTIEAVNLAPALSAAASAAWDLAGKGGSGLFDGLGKVFGGDLMSDSVPGVGSFADALSAGVIPLANGGIMTDRGLAPLRKYAGGGIATGPQVALYGEAGMNEAYVPLPDGKTIPVTMQGGGAAPNVTLNVINQSGTPVNAQQGQPRFDGKQMVLDIVLTAANQPGSFRDGMRGALT